MNRCYGVEMNVEESKVIVISNRPSSVQIMVNKKINYLSSMISDARCMREIKIQVSISKVAFNEKKIPLTR